jgi:3-hydroxyanthranilate 3,4-dioxygenase
MFQMPIVNLLDPARVLAETGRQVSVLWQEPESLVFLARGREHRSEFHINPSDEVMYQIKGEMRLHYRTPEGREEVAVISEGSVIHTPAGTPHSPRFPPDAFALILKRKRREGEIDRFLWFCAKCGALLHEETFIVRD